MNDNEAQIKKAEQLLYRLINLCYESAQKKSLTVVHHGNRLDLTGVYYATKICIEKLNRHESTKFLRMSVLKGALQNILECALVNLNDLVEQKIDPFNLITQLQQLFRDDPWQELWEKQAKNYKNALLQMGFSIDTTDYQDLNAIAEPIIDALTFYEPDNKCVYCMAEGPTTDVPPLVSSCITKYDSENDFLNALKQAETPAVIAFGAVEKTLKDTFDIRFYTDMHGYSPEIVRNLMLHNHMTEDEAANEIRQQIIYVGLKNGENLYLIQMPIRNGAYRLQSDETLYWNGKRTSFAPYQVFYKDLAPANADTVLPAVKRSTYRLSDIMDDMQKIWLPIFLNETINHVFKNMPNAISGFLPEQTNVLYKNTKDAHPVRYVVSLPAIKDCIDGPAAELFQFFRIHDDDIWKRLQTYLPLPALGICIREKLNEDLKEKVKDLCYDEIAVRLTEWLKENRSQGRAWAINWVFEHTNDILQKAKNGELSNFSVLSDKYQSRTNWSSSSRNFTAADGIQSPYASDRYVPIKLWDGPALKKPVWMDQIHPKTVKDFICLTGLPEDKLPDIIRLQPTIQAFCDEQYKYWRKFETTATTIDISRQNENPKCMALNDQLIIQICMSARVRKNYKERSQHGE